VRGDQFHATAGQVGIQAVRLVGVVTDETHRERLDKPLREGCVDQGDFVRRGTLDVNRERESAAIGNRHDLRALPALRLAHAGASLLRRCEAPIDEGFLQIQVAFVVESLGEDLENAPQYTRAHPLLKPPVARLIGGIPVREIGPWGAGPEDPWAPPAVCAARQLGQEGPNQNPLLVGEVTGMRSSRKSHSGQNGPVAIWLLAPTPKSVARSASLTSSPVRFRPGAYNSDHLPLRPGTRLGVYAVTAPIGEGGMGQVFRARDTTLNRDVALKVLPDSFANDPDRLIRFTREAQTLASLNHPNIAHIYGVEESGGVRALVMELVEGDDLSQRIARGAIPIDEALPIAKQIAEALEAAHEQGIIHRDLKPANIKVRRNGTVKVLDFGLAKMLPPRLSAAAEVTSSPTVTSPAVTHMGTVLGTAAYMSPEQAKGHPADRRSDIWSFGCVLYEMVTGKHPFGGNQVAETIARVIMQDPDWSALPLDTPASIRTLLRRCLQKDRARRLADIADAGLEIDDVKGHASRETTQRVHIRPRRSQRWIAASAIAIFLVAGGLLWLRRPLASLSEMRLELSTPPTTDPVSLAISPDGKKIAFIATADGGPRLWIRSLQSGTARPLAGTEGASLPFWSQNSQSIAFFADGKLKRTDEQGNSIQLLANAAGRGGAWNQDGTILFTTTNAAPLSRVGIDGGDPSPVTRIAEHQLGHSFPQFLPDNHHFLYYVRGDPASRGVYLSQLESPESRRLFDADSGAVYAARHLLFARDGTLFAQPFDPNGLKITGDAITVAAPIIFDAARGPLAASASSAGAIVFRMGSSGAVRQLTWLDRSGKELRRVGSPETAERLQNPSLSVDGQAVALYRRIGSAVDVWSLDLGRETVTRITFDAADDVLPIWSPDRSRLVFSSNRASKVHDLYVKSIAEGSPEEVLLRSLQFKHATDWSQDGKFVLFRSQDPKTDWDVWAVSVGGDRKAFPVVRTEFAEHNAQFSPDGKWIAYQSNETGRFEIYIQPFPRGTKTVISPSGGAQVRWRRDGTELFYIALDGRLMAVPIRLDFGAASVGRPVPLFVTRVGGAVQGTDRHQYMVSPDGSRFLLNMFVSESLSAPITLVLNWAGASQR
jgi:serine/threonine protein kinase